MTRLHPDDIQAIAERVISLLDRSAIDVPVPANMSVNDRAMMLARQGKRLESMELMKAHSRSCRKKAA